MATMKKITATGAKGFLKWLKQYNPKLYSGVAPLLPSKMPQLFAQFEAAGGLKGLACRRRSRMGSLGQTGSTFGATAGATGFDYGNTGSTSWGMTGNTGSGGTGTTGWGTGVTGSTAMMQAGQTGVTAPINTGATGSTNVSAGGGGEISAGGGGGGGGGGGSVPMLDVSDAANPGPLSSPDANSLAAIANDVASATESVGDAYNTASAINTQLTRAQSGLAPLPIIGPYTGTGTSVLSGTGLSSMTSTEWLWLGAAVLGGGLLLMSGKRPAA